MKHPNEYKTKCKYCGKSIWVEWAYDYDDEYGKGKRDKRMERCYACADKQTIKWQKAEAKKAAKYLVVVKDIKQFSSKKEFIKQYNTLRRSGVEINPEDKGEKCRFCGGKNLFRYHKEDWERDWELLCVDCMEKIIKAIKKL